MRQLRRNESRNFLQNQLCSGDLAHDPYHSTTFDLGGKTALVTGGSRGLGLQIAEALGLEARVRLACCYAALLHDVLEDTQGYSYEKMVEDFGWSCCTFIFTMDFEYFCFSN